jgi:NADH dehydrogenase [ubiquinone] 1 alpha subcomplex assembly factor 7
MTPLEKRLITQIERSGPMSVADYMTQCLLDPQHGYYTNVQPFGARGDFVTAPDVSQMFGELLGLSLAQSWIDQGSPTPFILAELGPGRGTLMADLLRAAAQVPGFSEAAEIWLVEASAPLRSVQLEALAGYKVNWAETVNGIPEGPLFLIANEFFDCLPIRQYRKTGAGWQEQIIGAEQGKLGFVLGAKLPDQAVPGWARDLPQGAMIETSSAGAAIAADIAHRISDKCGAAIIVDYGDWDSSGDTLQAVKSHRKVGPLDKPGQSDLTAHVNFAELARAAQSLVGVSKMIEQGELLHRLGIAQRAEALAKNCPPSALKAHAAAFRRLTHPDEMGQLFKMIAFHPTDATPPPGFDA